jgi:ferredoxin-NADP reductase
MRVYFDHLVNETGQIRTFFFRPETRISYTAGQYIELNLKHDHPDSRGTKRWFTLSSSPNSQLITITTRIIDESSSFKKALLKLKKGDELNINGPFGDFVLPKLIQTPLVFVAGGIGITPFHSILAWLEEAKEVRPIKFLYAVRTEDDIIFLEVFNKPWLHSTVVVTEPSPAWGGERGKLSAEMIVGLTNPNEDTLIYLSGPEPMVEDLGKDLLKSGIKKQQLVQDFFPNYPDY